MREMNAFNFFLSGTRLSSGHKMDYISLLLYTQSHSHLDAHIHNNHAHIHTKTTHIHRNHTHIHRNHTHIYTLKPHI